MQLKIKSTVLCSFILTTSMLKAQIPSTGNWPINAGQTGTGTLHNVGIGVMAPDGKLEIKYQPCQTQQNGVVISSLNCNTSNGGTWTLGPTYNSGLIECLSPYDNSIGIINTVPIANLLIGGAAFPVTTVATPMVTPNFKPMFWIRDYAQAAQVPGTLGYNGAYFSTRFIVLPNGNTGINTNNPRAVLDVVNPVLGSSQTPTATFSQFYSGGSTSLNNQSNTPTGVYGFRTAQIMLYNNLEAYKYNRIVKANDQAILFTDGNATDGSNTNGALVIAPFAANALSGSTVGGIRIDKDGNLDVHNAIRCRSLKVRPKWWADTVFNQNYNLITLDSVSNYITANKHLPYFPSENEVKENGIELSEMQAIQTKSLEELYLQVLQLNAIVQQQQALINNLTAKKQ